MNLTRSQKFIAFVCLAVVFVFVAGHSVQAYYENFDALTIGALSGQSGWYSGTDTNVNNSSYSSSPNSARFTSNSGEIYHTASSSDSFNFSSFNFNITGRKAEIQANTSVSWDWVIVFNASGVIQINNGSGWVRDIATVSTSSWHSIGIYSSYNANLYSVAIDNEYVLTAATSTINAEIISYQWKNTTGTGYFYFDNFFTEITTQNIDNAEVIEPDWPDDVIVQTGVANFSYQKDTYCYVGQTNACDIRIDYSWDDIGSMVLLLPAGEENLMNYEDLILSLADQDALRDVLTATTSENVEDKEYWIFLAPLTGSSSLFTDIEVHWIASTTDDIGTLGYIGEFFKGIFPISLWLDVRTTIKSHVDAATSTFSFSFSDIVDESLTGELYDDDAVVFSANWFAWEYWVYFYEYVQPILIWIFTLIIIMIEVWLVFRQSA